MPLRLRPAVGCRRTPGLGWGGLTPTPPGDTVLLLSPRVTEGIFFFGSGARSARNDQIDLPGPEDEICRNRQKASFRFFFVSCWHKNAVPLPPQGVKQALDVQK